MSEILPSSVSPQPRLRAWIVWVIVLLLLLVLVAAAVLVYALRRQPQASPTTSPAAEVESINPFEQEGEFINSLEQQQAEANPFYVNPFGKFKEEMLDEETAVQNPFVSPSL